ncbi:ATP-binding protein [Allonocardiopsis opalescens]|uniref:ATP-binding protein n=1 Tax=Allonocardiopsis opalescens TaxID=1144618 RepID=UPI001B801425|nr:DUF4143 domain-containing protein [Allonocardiopsis opalescens]
MEQLVADLPAVMVTGPRACGKTTTAARLARTVVRLDREREAAAFQADPDAALRGLPEPVLLDEWQVVPGVLGAIKRTLDDDPYRPGRFVLTGSVRADLEQAVWPGTGRVVRLAMTGLTAREERGSVECPAFFDRIAEQGAESLVAPADPPDLRDYVELAVRGGFPEPALRLPERSRRRWYEGYAEQLLTRDAELAGAHRDPVRLRRFFSALALNTAGTVDMRTLFEAAGVSRDTAEAYERLLRSLFVVDAAPAWSTQRLKRLVRTPKRYVVDPGLAAALIGVGAEGVMRDGNLLGRMIETFVYAQLRAEAAVGDLPAGLYHLRQDTGRREVDLVAEIGAGQVVGIEIKASSAPAADSARHLAWLRDQLGSTFELGIVFHTGPRVYPLDERIVAAPIAAIWS